jgi:YjjG family noncanonical pyrimidine nucleotidase
MLIFDLDNTVFDYEMAEKYALDKTLTHFNIPVSDAIMESYRNINKKTWLRLEKGEITSEQLRIMRFEEFGRVSGIDWQPAEVSRIYLGNLGQGSFTIEGAEELLISLKRVFRLASVTNGISDVQRSRLAHSGLDNFFDPLIISDEVGVAKPDPGIFRILLEKAGIDDKDSVLMIGDSLSSDIQGANAVGIDSCWYNPSGLSAEDGAIPDFIIKNLQDIKDIVL